MNSIHLQQTLPQVFADRNSVTSDIWHQDLIFRKGEMCLIEAASGTGKSSLCSYIYGYRNDYQGIINFDETNIKAYSVKQWVDLRKHSLSMLFQDLRIFTELTALENVQLKNNLTGYKKKKEILAFFEKLGLSDKLNVKTGKLSFGQQQRVAFIRALCQPFDFLFLDEPTTYLDISHQLEILQLLKQLNRRQGVTVVMVLHDLNHAIMFSDHLVAIKNGEKYLEGAPEQVITPQMLREVFDVEAEVIQHPVLNVPVCLPYGVRGQMFENHKEEKRL